MIRQYRFVNPLTPTVVRQTMGSRVKRLLVGGLVALSLATGLGLGLAPDHAAAQTSEEIEIIECTLAELGQGLRGLGCEGQG
jgi:hypothetical protein